MSEGSGDTISVRCVCGKKLKAPASAVGRKARCPKCGNVVTLEAPDDLGPVPDFDQPAAAPPPEEQGFACPNCSSPMDDGAVLCMSCGYDTRTGQTLGVDIESEPVAAAPPPLPTKAAATGTRYVPPALKTKVDTAAANAPTGSIMKGVIFSAVLTFIGSLVWYGIAKGTHREIGWIAWGIGVAAGFGMIAGYNGHSVHSGMVAAAIAVGGILLGKFMVFQWVLLPMVSGVGSQISDADKLEMHVANEQLVAMGIDPENSTDAQDRAAQKKAQVAISKMDVKQREAKTAEARAAFEEFLKELEKGGGISFASMMFDVKDIVFIVLAVASAFKIATFGGEVDNS